MALQIRITPAALHAAAQRQRTVADAVDETSARLSSLVGALGAAWEGSGSSMALNTLEDLVNGAKEIGRGTVDCGERLDVIAQAFEALDGGSPMALATHTPIGHIVRLLGADSPIPMMITDSLRIVPEEVRAVAAQCNQISDTFVETAGELNALVASLAGEWEGNSYNRFAADTRELSDAFEHFADCLKQYSGMIRTMADRYEELDNALSS